MVGEVISAEAETPQCKPPEGKPNKIVAMQLTTFPSKTPSSVNTLDKMEHFVDILKVPYSSGFAGQRP
jgi:hypothetical protein